MSIVPSPLRNPLPGLFAKAQPRSVPLAWRNLVANKQRLLRSAAGIGFAVLLMLMQLGFEQAFFDSTLEVIRALDGDILIQSVHKYQFATRDPFPAADLDTARQVTGVASARPLHADWFGLPVPGCQHQPRKIEGREHRIGRPARPAFSRYGHCRD